MFGAVRPQRFRADCAMAHVGEQKTKLAWQPNSTKAVFNKYLLINLSNSLLVKRYWCPTSKALGANELVDRASIGCEL